MDTLLGTLLSSGGESAEGSACDTFSDQLSCVYTVFLLAVFTFLTTTKSFVGNRVSCWCPSHFTSSHEAYTNQVTVDNTHSIVSATAVLSSTFRIVNTCTREAGHGISL